MNAVYRPRFITMTTDFGVQDEYVGVMKGMIYQYAPLAKIIDITHRIPSQSIIHGAHVLSRAYRYFPLDTIHLAIVDPGVGSARRMLVIAAQNYFFIGPDNGIFSSIFTESPEIIIHQIDPEKFLAKSSSSTFHGRDIMAPVAGLLASGKPLEWFGPQIASSTCCHLEEKPPSVTATEIIGTVLYIDSFGNACTNISRDLVTRWANGQTIAIYLSNRKKIPFFERYSDVDKGVALALIDSHDFVEIAVNQGNAAKTLLLSIGDSITITITSR